MVASAANTFQAVAGQAIEYLVNSSSRATEPSWPSGAVSSSSSSPGPGRRDQGGGRSMSEEDAALARRIYEEEQAMWWPDPARGRPPGHHQERPIPRAPPGNPTGGGSLADDEALARQLQQAEIQEFERFEQQQVAAVRSHMGVGLPQGRPIPPGLVPLLMSMRGRPPSPPQWPPRVRDAHPAFGEGVPPALLRMLAQGQDPQLTALLTAFVHNPQDAVDRMSYEDLLQLEEQIGIVTRGATAEQIENLPTTTARNPRPNAEAPSSCGVCLEDYEAGQPLRTLPCLHQFHRDCVDQWLRMNRCCPVCKNNIC